MKKYLLDTNTIVYLCAKDSPLHLNVYEKFVRLENDAEVVVSILTLYEMEHGLASYRVGANDMLVHAVRFMKRHFRIMPLDEEGAFLFGRMKAAFQKMTGNYSHTINRHNVDFMIASTAVAMQAVLVSNDQMFVSVKACFPDLLLLNWADVNQP